MRYSPTMPNRCHRDEFGPGEDPADWYEQTERGLDRSTGLSFDVVPAWRWVGLETVGSSTLPSPQADSSSARAISSIAAASAGAAGQVVYSLCKSPAFS